MSSRDMTFDTQSIYSVMADEICRGKRHVRDTDTGATCDDGLSIRGGKNNWKGGSKGRKRGILSMARRYQMQKEVSDLMKNNPDIPYWKAYYEANRDHIRESRKKRYETDEEFKRRNLERKRLRRVSDPDWHAKEKEAKKLYCKTHPEIIKASSKRDQARKKLIRQFIREQLCDECLQALHGLLISTYMNRRE